MKILRWLIMREEWKALNRKLDKSDWSLQLGFMIPLAVCLLLVGVTFGRYEATGNFDSGLATYLLTAIAIYPVMVLQRPLTAVIRFLYHRAESRRASRSE